MKYHSYVLSVGKKKGRAAKPPCDRGKGTSLSCIPGQTGKQFVLEELGQTLCVNAAELRCCARPGKVLVGKITEAHGILISGMLLDSSRVRIPYTACLPLMVRAPRPVPAGLRGCVLVILVNRADETPLPSLPRFRF